MTVVLSAVSAKYVHKSLSVWCLHSYCKAKGQDILIREFTTSDHAQTIAASLIHAGADIAAFSCYLWNIELVAKVCVLLKQIKPGIIILLGGPEVLDAPQEGEAAYPYADYILTGEGEELFYRTVCALNKGQTVPRIQCGKNAAAFASLPSPYTPDFFQSFRQDNAEISSRLIYYESTRGCPFSCAYCLSGDDKHIRALPTQRVAEDISLLLRHGVKTVKFVDRTFNADKKRCYSILKYLYALDTDAVFHLECAADLFDQKTLELLAKMPPGRVQLEIGLQSTDDAVLQTVCRKTNIPKALQTIKHLSGQNNIHVHTDLIAGLPGERAETFRAGFHRLMQCRPHDIQLGFLKYLKGSTLRRSRAKDQYSPFPPYEVLSSDGMTFVELQLLKRAEDTLEHYYNSSLFRYTIDMLLREYYPDDSLQLFIDLADFIQTLPLSTSLKNRYRYLYLFSERLAGPEKSAHYIRYDSLLHNEKPLLFSEAPANRMQQAEQHFIAGNKGLYPKVYAEYFPLTKQTLLFLYGKRHPVTKEFGTKNYFANNFEKEG